MVVKKLKKPPAEDLVVKRREKQQIALFVDGTNLDRACKRLKKRISLSSLLKSLSTGKELLSARYYTIVPFEDDSRQRAYLDAVERAGFEVVVKRLPPKGVERPVTVDVEMASDIIYFSYAKTLREGTTRNISNTTTLNTGTLNTATDTTPDTQIKVKRSLLVVCPSSDLAYSLALANESGTLTTTVDFSKGIRHDVISSSDNWIDLTESVGIWL